MLRVWHPDYSEQAHVKTLIYTEADDTFHLFDLKDDDKKYETMAAISMCSPSLTVQSRSGSNKMKRKINPTTAVTMYCVVFRTRGDYATFN